MSSDIEFRRAIEEIKLRAPLESIVAETVELKQKGNQLWGCCPFHEERTASFKVDPQAEIWYCFGACRKGGDVIQFVQERGNMTFMDALELLAAQTGVELPRRKPRKTRDNDPGLAALGFAAEFFQRELARPEGKQAREYLASRGFGENAIEAFGLGWAPRASARFMEAAANDKISTGALVDAGLARESSQRQGDFYSFFRGRLMIPIRDERGGTVAFGGRVVGDDDGPKYVNTGETRYFHKGRLIYALDRALEAVRRTGHLILVEGYTDVMAAHVAGMSNVGAVLGTATTEMHAALIRRAGTRRVSLVFDGDEAGRRAAWRGLEGLLPLDLVLEVVPLPEGLDPADIAMGPDGGAAFSARIETGTPWFDFVADCVAAKRPEGGRALALEVDRALELFQLLPRPVEVDSAVSDLARRLEMPVDSLRDQLRALKDRRPTGAGSSRRGQARGQRGPSPAGPQGADGRSQSESSVTSGGKVALARLDPSISKAYECLIAAALLETSLIPRLRPWIAHGQGNPPVGSTLEQGPLETANQAHPRDARGLQPPDPALFTIFQTLIDLYDHEEADITASLLINQLAGQPAADQVARIMELGWTADDPARLFEGAYDFLKQREQHAEIRRLQESIQDLEPLAGTDPSAGAALENALMRLIELKRSTSGPVPKG